MLFILLAAMAASALIYQGQMVLGVVAVVVATEPLMEREPM
jgi:hypothetical protein